MIEYIILHGKKYPKSLIEYLLSKSIHKGKSTDQFTEKYLDEMKEVVKSEFEQNGITKGKLASFSEYSIPLWMDIAEAKGYKLINIKNTSVGVQADVVKKDRKKENTKPKSKRKIVKKCGCK